MKQYAGDDWEVTDPSINTIAINLYPNRPDEESDIETRLTLTVSDAEGFARALIDKIIQLRAKAGNPLTYVDVETSSWGPASGLRFVPFTDEADGSALEDASDGEIREYGEEYGW